MQRIKSINLIILLFLALGISYGAEAYDEIVNDLKTLHTKLGFIYGRYVHGTPAEKSNACEEMEEVCKKIEETLQDIPLHDVSKYILIDVKTIQEKVDNFRRSKKNTGGCIEFFKSDLESKVFESYLRENGLRGLLKNLINHLEANNNVQTLDCDTVADVLLNS